MADLVKVPTEDSAAPAPPSGLAYLGVIVTLAPIPNADRLLSAEVECGTAGGRWWGVVSTADGWATGMYARVFLPDALVPQTDEFAFMARYRYRVKVQKLRGARSEVLIMPRRGVAPEHDSVGDDITAVEGVRKFEKPQPGQQNSARVRTFPVFIPRTDEPHIQRARHLLEVMRGQPVAITQKLDGSSMTLYHHLGHIGVCSRNQEIEPDDSAWWRVGGPIAHRLPEGVAVQGELVGPAIQGNPLGLDAQAFMAFSIYDITARRYQDFESFQSFCQGADIPMVPYMGTWHIFNFDDLELFETELLAIAEAQSYPNGQPAEGIVVRPMTEQVMGVERVSLKVLNPLYKG